MKIAISVAGVVSFLSLALYAPTSLSGEETDPKYTKIANELGLSNIKASEVDVKSVKTFRYDDVDYIAVEFAGPIRSPDGNMRMTRMETSFSSKECYVPTSAKRIRIYSGDGERYGMKFRNQPFCMEDISEK